MATRDRVPRTPLLLLAALLAATLALAAPARPAGASPAVQPAGPAQVSAGGAVCAIALDDTLSCWGSDHYGGLGRGDWASSQGRFPGKVVVTGTVLEGRSYREVAAGGAHTCALTTDRKVACWGANFGRMLGGGTAGEHTFTPVELEVAGTSLEGRVIDRIVAGGSHTCVLTTDDAIACWGANGAGQLGNGTISDYSGVGLVTTAGTPLNGKAIASVVPGATSTCALATDGTAACWGEGVALGTGGFADSPVPVAPSRGAGSDLPAEPIRSISPGYEHTCAATVSGTAYCWGRNRDHQLGDGTDFDHLLPKAVAVGATPLAGERVVEVATSPEHSCARTEAGRLACWGLNFQGQLGSGTTIDSDVPIGVITSGTPLAGMAIDRIDLQSYLSCASSADGTTACWGSNLSYGLGNGSYQNSSLAVAPLVPSRPGNVEVHPGGGKARVTWSPSTAPNGGGLSGYAVVAYVAGVRQQPILVPADQTSAVVERLPVDARVQVRVVAQTVGITGPGSGLTAAVVARPTSTYVPVAPCRIVDTRLRGGKLGNREQRSYAVTGTGSTFAAQGGRGGGCGVPAGALAVEATVSAVDPSGGGFVRAWPVGESMPNATFLTVAPRQSRTNTGAISLATSGARQLNLRNFGTSGDFVIDVQGYYADQTGPELGSAFVPLYPCRIADSRQTVDKAYANREIRSLAVAGAGPAFQAQGGRADGCNIPEGAVAAEVSVTVIAGGSGFTRVWPADQSMPNATFLNSSPGDQLTNTGSVKLAATGTAGLKVRTFLASADVVVDIQGYYLPPGAPPAETNPHWIWPTSVYVPMTPCRLVDTRQAGGSFEASTSRAYLVRGDGSAFAAQGGAPGGCGIPLGASAAEVTLTAVDPTNSGYLRASPADGSSPNATILNFDVGSSTTNTGTVALSPWPPDLALKSFAGASHFVVEAQGYYLPVEQVPT